MTPQTLILNHDDVAAILRIVGLDNVMLQLINRMTSVFEDPATATLDVPVRSGFYYDQPASGLVEWMPLHEPGRAVFQKAVGYHPRNPVDGRLPTVIASLQKFDPRTGALLAIADGRLMTALRTGAGSAVATRYFADLSRPVRLGLVGCGAQAVTQWHALTQVAELREIVVADRDESVARSFAERIRPFRSAPISVTISSAQDVVESADVVCTATSVEVGAGPVIPGDFGHDSIHINAVGSDLPGKTEIPIEVLRQSFVCPDFYAQAIVEGECQQLNADEIGPSILEVGQNPSAYSDTKASRTVFDSTGWAVEDWVVLDLFVELAEATELGRTVEFTGDVDDPWNPYESLVPSRVPLETDPIGTFDAAHKFPSARVEP